jgi:hypothetical protein
MMKLLHPAYPMISADPEIVSDWGDMTTRLRAADVLHEIFLRPFWSVPIHLKTPDEGWGLLGSLPPEPKARAIQHSCSSGRVGAAPRHALYTRTYDHITC